jgi:hypothetical protein
MKHVKREMRKMVGRLGFDDVGGHASGVQVIVAP